MVNGLSPPGEYSYGFPFCKIFLILLGFHSENLGPATNSPTHPPTYTGLQSWQNTPLCLHCARRGLDKTIVSTTAPERAVLSVLSLGVALRTDESGASEAAETHRLIQVYNPGRILRCAMLWSPTCCSSGQPHAVGERSFSEMAPHLWNSLPDSLRVSGTKAQFKFNLKTDQIREHFKD